MHFIVDKDFNGGPESGPFKIAKLSITRAPPDTDPIEDPGLGTEVDITVLVDQGALFKSDDDLKAAIASTFDIPVANVDVD